MSKVIINIKADREVKRKAQKIAAGFGMPLSTVINGYLHEFIRTKEIHFSLRDSLPLGKPEGVLKPSVARRLARIHKEIQAGKGLSPAFYSAEDAIRYLRS
ncbi:MAG: hypothetical protein AAB699_01080 [Patescibacteria group bacterium]